MLALLGNLLKTVASLPKAAAINARNAAGLTQAGSTPLGTAARKSLGMPVPQPKQFWQEPGQPKQVVPAGHVEQTTQTLAKRLGTPFPSQQQVDAERTRIQTHNTDQDKAEKKNPVMAIGEAIKSGFKVAGFAGAVIGATKAILKLTDAANDAAIAELRKFNSGIAGQAARREAFEMRYNVKRGKLVEGSTRELSEARMQRDEQFQPYSALGENLFNELGIVANKAVSGIGYVLEGVGLTQAIQKYLAGNVKESEKLDTLMWMTRGILHMPREFPMNKRPKGEQVPFDKSKQRGAAGLHGHMLE